MKYLITLSLVLLMVGVAWGAEFDTKSKCGWLYDVTVTHDYFPDPHDAEYLEWRWLYRDGTTTTTYQMDFDGTSIFSSKAHEMYKRLMRERVIEAKHERAIKVAEGKTDNSYIWPPNQG